MDIVKQLAHELSLGVKQVTDTIALLDDGNTIPFIARYRKEATGELDEVQIHALAERLTYLRGLVERQTEITRLINEQGKLTDDLRKAITEATSLQELDDIYRPYRPKRRTRASMAKDRGLEPLANKILAQDSTSPDELCPDYLTDEVPTVADVKQGAQDILAEYITDLPEIRQEVRRITYNAGLLVCEASGDSESEEAQDFKMYFDYVEEIRKIPPHRVLAINRGERLKVLKVKFGVDQDLILKAMGKFIIKNPDSPGISWINEAIEDGYTRLLAPSIEREIRNSLTETAEEHGISIFATNLRNLLMQSPVRGRNVLGIDPAYRTGCKVVAVNEYGDLLAHTTIYPHAPQNRWDQAKETLKAWISKYDTSLVTIGNGTASRETEQLVAELIQEANTNLQYLVVNEAGASVYSASELAREEFPELDVSIRGAISIARRVQDPLAEFVKIDPKSIGVGQYQHDVNQKELSNTLGFVVESCVNFAGVELNSASAPLLRYVSGLSNRVAHEIVNFRHANGTFTKRSQLKKVKGLGPKAFQQAAGFLRIASGDDPLDNTAVHPESYALARQILEQIGYTTQDLQDKEILSEIRSKLKKLNPRPIAESLGAGEPTVRDIIDALGQPGRDPRDELPAPLFRADVLTIEDLKPGMRLKGTVQNVVDFGAFIDIGVKKAGLVHISQLSDKYVNHPTDIVQVGDIVDVHVLNVDPQTGRIGLTMKTHEYA